MTRQLQGRRAIRSAAPLGTGRSGWTDAGSATAELAMGLPALVLMIFISVTAVTAVVTQMQCVDAAREAARAAARGEPGVAAGRRVAPGGASVAVTETGGTVRAEVRTRVHPLGGRLPGLEVAATAVAVIEPDLAAAP